MAWLTLAIPSEAGKVSHKVQRIISGAEGFNSACSDVLLIFLCRLMWSREHLKVPVETFRMHSEWLTFVSGGRRMLLSLPFC